MGKEFTKTGIATALALSVLLACGGEARAPHLMGSVTVDGIEFGLGGARGTVLNMPRTIYWAGVAMPAFVQIELFAHLIEFKWRRVAQGHPDEAIRLSQVIADILYRQVRQTGPVLVGNAVDQHASSPHFRQPLSCAF